MGSNGAYPPISDYGLISNMHSCALVSNSGSIDWCCLPRFDSASVFGRILDWRKGGYYQLIPLDVRSVTRKYVPGTLVLETTFETDMGTARLTDFMLVDGESHTGTIGETVHTQQVVRVLDCLAGSVRYRMERRPRFDYGTVVPHVSLDGYHNGFAHGGANGMHVTVGDLG